MTLESKKLTPLIQNSDQPRDKTRIRLPHRSKIEKQDLEPCFKLSHFTIELDQNFIE